MGARLVRNGRTDASHLMKRIASMVLVLEKAERGCKCWTPTLGMIPAHSPKTTTIDHELLALFALSESGLRKGWRPGFSQRQGTAGSIHSVLRNALVVP